MESRHNIRIRIEQLRERLSKLPLSKVVERMKLAQEIHQLEMTEVQEDVNTFDNMIANLSEEDIIKAKDNLIMSLMYCDQLEMAVSNVLELMHKANPLLVNTNYGNKFKKIKELAESIRHQQDGNLNDEMHGYFADMCDKVEEYSTKQVQAYKKKIDRMNKKIKQSKTK